ncbi:asparagine synthase (glutamine-hydrolyzing) [Brevibacillus sp. HB1.4B]|uniref:asparagine synthase (glutamine-hydrolyzing) n=1 Tax=Brevibacillus TaxID=55080 RepID=UPI000363A179|nr:asparagine synthase (glutamine-hydrolyzing) [Brevibacillus sp. HB1.4B]ATF15956.1 asparagine synthetase B [Brevibacillus brevis X23]NRS18467.1 asparagine synthase (glutamine-hydrolyzing) [Brevibacillus sp. HB1.4B]
MCGIAGILSNRGAFDEIKHQGRNMLDAIAHRGPDGFDEWMSPENRLWIGHRRLAIIDPEGGKQPLSNEDGTVWITFNGCIYNYMELAQNLRSKGHRFRTYSDTEVIVHAYEEFGIDCLKYFIGMFSFAIWDDRKKLLFCARDRMGVKPFYYWHQNETFMFASEIKALLSTGQVTRNVDQHSLEEYLVFQTVLGEKTLFDKVKKLPPGHYMLVDPQAGIQKIEKYWDLNFDIDYEHTEEYFTDRLKVLIDDAVKIRLRSDVSLGAHLSGGLDSSTVVSLASMLNVTGSSLNTFTGAFEEGERFDETRYAKLVAQQTGATYNEIYPSSADFMETLPKIIRFMDEPAAGPGVFPQFMVSKLASEHVKVVLGGQGGDEIFAGYTRYLVGYLEECLKGAIMETQHRGEYAATLASIIPSLPMLQQYVPMLKYFWADGLFSSQDERYFRLMDRSGDTKAIYSSDLFSHSDRVVNEFGLIFNGSNAASFLNKMLYFDMKVHLPALLHVEDRTSMAWGLESRVPLLDHRIAELMASIPPAIKFKGGQPKYLFKKVIKNHIPDEVFNRKDKMGFPVPLNLWYKDALLPFVREILLDKKARERGIFQTDALEKAISNEKDFGRVTWGALCLELWFKTFIDGQ